MKPRLKALALTLLLILLGCAAAPRPISHEEELRELNEHLDRAEADWIRAIDDPYTKPELKDAYQKIQDLCRCLHKKKTGFATTEEQKLCWRVEYPFTIYFNKLKVETNNLREQLFKIKKEGTAANEYMRRPSKENELKLKTLFNQVYRYYVGRPYSWHRYYSKYLFQRSRLDHFRREFEERDLEYKKARANGEPEEEIMPTVRELGIAFVAYSPLGRGFLAGRFQQPEDLPEGDWRRYLEENTVAVEIELDQEDLRWLVADVDELVGLTCSTRAPGL